MNKVGTGYDRTSGSVVSSVNETTCVVTVATGTAWADGDTAFIYSRAGFTTIDAIVQEDQATGAGTGMGGAAAEVRAYDLTYSGRVDGEWNAAARAGWNAGLGRDFTL